MKKTFLSLVAVLIAGLTINCGGGSGSGSSPAPVPVPTTGQFKLVNNTTGTVYSLYLSPSNSSTWGVDQLGASVVLSGSSWTVYNVPGGSYDTRIVFTSGNYWDRYGIIISNGYTTTLTLSGTAPIAVPNSVESTNKTVINETSLVEKDTIHYLDSTDISYTPNPSISSAFRYEVSMGKAKTTEQKQ